jgi:hypothetical protein
MGNYDHEQYASGQIYPLQNPIDQGYAVKMPGVDPRNKSANGRMTNQLGEEIDFYIEEIETNFAMSGTTAQSRNVRQFMPHNVVQPAIKVKGRAPDNHQYNRLASFVRSSHYHALHYGEDTRKTITTSGKKVKTETVRLWIKNGQTPEVWNGNGNRKSVKGIHVPWLVEGYIKSISAGGERFNFQPEFEFEFYVAESIFKQGEQNLGMWEDTRVYGAELKPWLDWIKKGGMVEPQNASVNTLDAEEKKKNNPAEQSSGVDPGSNPFDVPPLQNLPENEVDGPPAPPKNIFE